MELLGDDAQVESRLVRWEIVLILMQHRCTVCARHIIGSEIILDARMVLQGDEAQVEGHFVLVRNSANLHAR